MFLPHTVTIQQGSSGCGLTTGTNPSLVQVIGGDMGQTWGEQEMVKVSLLQVQVWQSFSQLSPGCINVQLKTQIRQLIV